MDRTSPPDGTGYRRERRAHELCGFGQGATRFGVAFPPERNVGESGVGSNVGPVCVLLYE